MLNIIDKNTIRLLRFPFSIFLMPVFLLAISQQSNINWEKILWAFGIVHLLVYPSSNGYNSYIDRDETSIGGLEKPPMPTEKLFYITVFMDIAALILSYIFVKPLFAACIVLYIAASRAYSSPQIRLKQYPFAGFAVVVFFQGAFTYFMASIACNDAPISCLANNNLWIEIATSLQIAGAYPLTQVYQHEADKKDGVTTISYVLGYRGTFLFSLTMFFCCNLFYGYYFYNTNQVQSFVLLQILFSLPLLYFGWWFREVTKDIQAANFKNTMRMNFFSSVSMILFSFALLYLKHL